MTTAGISSTFRPLMSISLIFTCCADGSSEKPGFSPALVTPDSLASLVLTSVSGAPVSKMSLYGPLPLTLTMMVMCPLGSVSNGTTTGLGASWARAGSATARTRPRLNSVRRITGPPRSSG